MNESRNRRMPKIIYKNYLVFFIDYSIYRIFFLVHKIRLRQMPRLPNPRSAPGCFRQLSNVIALFSPSSASIFSVSYFSLLACGCVLNIFYNFYISQVSVQNHIISREAHDLSGVCNISRDQLISAVYSSFPKNKVFLVHIIIQSPFCMVKLDQ